MQPHSTLDFKVCVGMLLVVVGKVEVLIAICSMMSLMKVFMIYSYSQLFAASSSLIVMFGLAEIT